jgi:hypothetical protein
MEEDLFAWTPPPPIPRGATFEPERDGPRLSAQAKRVFDLMQDGCWRGLREISEFTGDPEASVSARLRDLRRHYTVDRKYIASGLHRYRVVV